MPDAAPSPYDILGVTPAATAGDLKRAFGEAMKAGRYPMAAIDGAFRTLSDPQSRALIDLFLVGGGTGGAGADAVQRLLAELPPSEVPVRLPPAPPIGAALTDLFRDDLSASFREPPDLPLPAPFAPATPDPRRVLPPFEFPM